MSNKISESESESYIIFSVELNHCAWDVLCFNIQLIIVLSIIFSFSSYYDQNVILMLILDPFSDFNYLFNFS